MKVECVELSVQDLFTIFAVAACSRLFGESKPESCLLKRHDDTPPRLSFPLAGHKGLSSQHMKA